MDEYLYTEENKHIQNIGDPTGEKTRREERAATSFACVSHSYLVTSGEKPSVPRTFLRAHYLGGTFYIQFSFHIMVIR